MYELERTTGWGGLILFFAAVVTAAFFLLYLRCGPATYVAGVATLVGSLGHRTLLGSAPTGSFSSLDQLVASEFSTAPNAIPNFCGGLFRSLYSG